MCPACGHHVAVPFLDPGAQPLATLGWPGSAASARRMPRLPLRFVRCVDCGHVYNEAFDYDAVPYSDKPNRMFNQGTTWSEYLRDATARLARLLPARPVVVEIGHGDGSFLASLERLRPEGRYVGFDPHGVEAAGEGPLEFRPTLFDPAVHLAELRPDLLISRHVLEHLTNPLGFMQRIGFAATALGMHPRVFIEVPCIDQAVESGRTVDFFYEHNSHFTTESFQRMLKRCASAVEIVGHGYGREVVYGLVRLGGAARQLARAQEAAGFRTAARDGRVRVKQQLSALYRLGARVAVWGGTGKAAAFLNRYGLDALRFPTVVDSDPEKAGTFVPGTGQEIRFRDWLLTHPVDVVIIPSQWRAGDIVDEMSRAGIAVERILIEDCGRLAEYAREQHPDAQVA